MNQIVSQPELELLTYPVPFLSFQSVVLTYCNESRKRTPAKSPTALLVTPGVLKPMAFNLDDEVAADAALEAKKKRIEEEKTRLTMEEPLLRPNPRRYY